MIRTLRTLTATFDGEVLRPDAPLGLEPNTRCLITVQVPPTSAVGKTWDEMGELAAPAHPPRNWAKEHDHIYGASRRVNDAGL